jgi:hypothetical protein
MKIKEILSQSRRDFSATMVCEHCGHETLNKYGYDDDNYHRNVIPKMICPKCEKAAPENYRAWSPKYAAHEVV